MEFSNLSFIFPSWKTTSLIVHVPISSDSFDSNSNYFGLIKNDSGIVKSCFVQNRSSQLNNDVLCNTWSQNIFNDVPTMINCVIFSKMICTAIAWNFKLTSNSYWTSQIYTLLNGFHNMFVISFKVKGNGIYGHQTQFHM